MTEEQTGPHKEQSDKELAIKSCSDARWMLAILRDVLHNFVVLETKPHSDILFREAGCQTTTMKTEFAEFQVTVGRDFHGAICAQLFFSIRNPKDSLPPESELDGWMLEIFLRAQSVSGNVHFRLMPLSNWMRELAARNELLDSQGPRDEQDPSKRKDRMLRTLQFVHLVQDIGDTIHQRMQELAAPVD